MPAALDLTGRTFGRLVVLHRDSKDAFGAWLWRCRCACGAEHAVRGATLAAGRTQSCASCAAVARSTTHGQTGSPLYIRWRAMLDRTHNPKHRQFSNYGGRGILVCDAWRDSFDAFARDMGDGFDERLELDRIDVDGHYEPSNCRWVDRQTQQRNRRNNHLVTHDGKTQTVVAWAEQLHLKANTIITRLRRGWSAARALANSEQGNG